MKYRGLTTFFLGVIFLLPPVIYAHGVSGKINAGGIVVAAIYDSGEPMSYAKVKISAPGAKITFQSGRTDKNGRFCFFPDTPGEWEVVVDDEMGHRLVLNVPVDETLMFQDKQQRGEDGESPQSRYEKAIMGISIIFGICGIFFWWKSRRAYRTKNQE